MTSPSHHDRLVLAMVALANGGEVGDVMARLRGLCLTLPIVLGRADRLSISVITPTPKHHGWYQRTRFDRDAGPTADDDLHATVESAVYRAYALGYTVPMGPVALYRYTPHP